MQIFIGTVKIIRIVLLKLSASCCLYSMDKIATFAFAKTVMKELKIKTKRGTLLDGVLFETDKQADTVKSSGIAASQGSDTVLICITGIHGNFYSNPFYYNIGDTLTAAGIDFIYAQTNDAFGAIRTQNVCTGQEEIIGSWNERFALTDEDVAAYLDYAEQQGYKHIILAGHSLGANKVIYYLSDNHDPRVEHFLLLSPANLDYMTASVTPQQREVIRQLYEQGDANKMLPFLLMGWVECTVGTAYDWVWGEQLNNVHTQPEGCFCQVSRITHSGALLIGTYDNFTDGDPSGFLQNINSHMPTAEHNKLIFIERTGHTYQQKQQELADHILQTIIEWRKE